jgi:hypothetical protein
MFGCKAKSVEKNYQNAIWMCYNMIRRETRDPNNYQEVADEE